MWLRVSTKRNLQALEDVSGWSQVYLSSSIDFRGVRSWCIRIHVQYILNSEIHGYVDVPYGVFLPLGQTGEKGESENLHMIFYFFASNLSVLSKAVSLFPTSTTFQRRICCISRAWNLHSIVHEMLSTLEDVAIFIIFLEYTYIFF